MFNILVSGASGIVGYGCMRSLRKSNLPLTIIATSIYEDSIANVFCDIFEKAPFTSDACYLDWLINIIQKYNIDLIIPCIEADVFKWNENRSALGKTKAKIVLNTESLINLCQDKWLFYEKLNNYLPQYVIPSTLSCNFDNITAKFGLPFLLKPRKGYASKGIVYINSEADFLSQKKNLGSKLMAQPIIGSTEKEYTIAAFFDNNSKLCSHISLKRKLAPAGFTEIANVVKLEQMESILNEMAAVFKPIGVTNFQFRVEKSVFKLLEINPRISSSTSIRTLFGYNESAMCVNYYLKGLLPIQPEIVTGKVIRYTEDYVLYDSNNI
jgi:carbamoyl-phosphate synthase large subunit